MAAPKPLISEMIEQEWGKITERIDVDPDGVRTLRDPTKPVLCWPNFIAGDMIESVDGTEVYCLYEFFGEFRQVNLTTKKQVELGRNVKVRIHHRDIKQCEIMDVTLLKHLQATRRVVDYSVSFGEPDEDRDLQVLAREITILY